MMFTSDGINDSPDLAAVEIGVAVGLAATDLELETAAIGLVADKLNGYPRSSLCPELPRLL